jgi:DNA-binding transcriptional regulator YdaS (Cro superfamily)
MPNIERLLLKAIELTGGTQASLGEAIGATQNAIYQAIQRRHVTAEMACAIHHATEGGVPAWKLRPDLWHVGQLPPSHGHRRRRQ